MKYNVDDCQIVELPIVHSETGNMSVLENNKYIPFAIKRVYYLYDVPMGAERGGHGHYELQQYVVAASGSFTFVLDDGTNKKEVFLNHPNKALHIKPGIWREMKDFSSGSICLVLASMEYTEDDYIREYDEFKKYRGNTIEKAKLKLIDYNREILYKTWSWLNDPEIKMLTDTPDFTREGQSDWFESLPTKKDYVVKGISFSGLTIGVAGLKNIDLKAGIAEYFGYIGDKEYWGKGLGGKILQEIKEIAQKEFGLHLIYLNVIPSNTRAINAYEKFGFRIENITNGNVKMFYKI